MFLLSRILISNEDSKDEDHGHITSLGVLRPYRRLGVAYKLMIQAHYAMKNIYNWKYCTLHTRESNIPAIKLYKDKLSYNLEDTVKEYYLDGENGILLKKIL